MSKNSKGLLISFVIIFLLILFRLNLESEIVQTLLDVLSTIGSAVIGGYVAFYVSRAQIESNEKLDYLRIKKDERTICLIVINDLEDVINRLQLLTTNDSDKDTVNINDIQKMIITDSLERFKNSFLYMLENEQDIKTYSSVLNRLLLFKYSDKEYVSKENVEDLINSCTEVLDLIKELLHYINEYIEDYDNIND